MVKSFRLAAEDIVAKVPGRGACMASDRITVDGLPVGYAYREHPDFPTDSGWRFFAGDETRDYADEASNFSIYDVNTIANYDPEIGPIVDVATPAAFERPARGGPLNRVS